MDEPYHEAVYSLLRRVIIFIELVLVCDNKIQKPFTLAREKGYLFSIIYKNHYK